MNILESLGISAPVILINIIAFLVLYALLRKVLYTPIGSVLEQRRERIARDRDEAAALRAEMTSKNAALEQRLAGLEAEVRDRMQAAEREATKVREEMLAAARTEREKIVAAGSAELAREREKLLVELRNVVADLAMSAAGKIVERELDLDAHRAMIDDIVEHGVK